MRCKKTLLLFALIGFFSFKPAEIKVFDFSYPKRKGTEISFSSNHFRKFAKEWRGEDYYYSTAGDGFVCSVLYFKLTDEEQLELVDAPRTAIGGPEKSPAYPYAYFKNNSNLKSRERNETSWGLPTDDFMFMQNDVVIEGIRVSQKNMYGYAMLDKDLFVKIHLSKVAWSAADSTEMRDILKSLVIKK